MSNEGKYFEIDLWPNLSAVHNFFTRATDGNHNNGAKGVEAAAMATFRDDVLSERAKRSIHSLSSIMQKAISFGRFEEDAEGVGPIFRIAIGNSKFNEKDLAALKAMVCSLSSPDLPVMGHIQITSFKGMEQQGPAQVLGR